MEIVFLVGRGDTEPLVEQVRIAADGERDALGFLPASAYSDFSYQNRLIVAVNDLSRELAGYVIFGGAMPQGRIFQTWVNHKYRGRGIARQLIDRVVRAMEASSYLSIRADVAQDLGHANAFYQSVGFETIKTRPGGKVRRRLINVMIRELATPSLLDWMDNSNLAALFSTRRRANEKTPLYVLDLNVLFDVTKRRLKAEDAGRVMSAAFENDFRIAVAAELLTELQRNSVPGTSDPTLQFALTLPRLAHPPQEWVDGISEEIALQVFPDRARAAQLTKQDNSDLIHLMTAIHECATGFVTSEKAILRSASYFKRQYGLDIVSPEALAPRDDQFFAENLVTTSGKGQVARVVREEDYHAISSFLLANQGLETDVRATLSAGTKSLPRRRFVIFDDDEIRAVAAWDAPSIASRVRDIHLYVDETSPFAAQYADHLVARAVADVGVHYPAIFEMRPAIGQSTLRRVALTNGFFPVGGSSPRTQNLRKIAYGVPISAANWADSKARLVDRAGILLPANMPKFTSATQAIELTDSHGKTLMLSLAELEASLSPTLIALPERPSAILPITQAYAEDLFRGSSQPLLLSDRQAIWHPTRYYICRAGSYSLIEEGCLVVFYESGTGGGRSAAIAAARVARRYLMLKDAAAVYAAHKGVLDAGTIHNIGLSPQVTVIEFDNLMLFENSVSLTRLREIGCADGANFVTAKRLMSNHLQEIFLAGKPYA